VDEGKGGNLVARYYLTLWLVQMCLCAWGALATAKKGVYSRPMVFATAGFVIMMLGSLVSLLGDGVARFVPLAEEVDDIFYLLTNLWTVANVVGLFLVVLGVQLSYRELRYRRRR
jgi:hypothetical protein